MANELADIVAILLERAKAERDTLKAAHDEALQQLAEKAEVERRITEQRSRLMKAVRSLMGVGTWCAREAAMNEANNALDFCECGPKDSEQDKAPEPKFKKGDKVILCAGGQRGITTIKSVKWEKWDDDEDEMVWMCRFTEKRFGCIGSDEASLTPYPDVPDGWELASLAQRPAKRNDYMLFEGDAVRVALDGLGGQQWILERVPPEDLYRQTWEGREWTGEWRVPTSKDIFINTYSHEVAQPVRWVIEERDRIGGRWVDADACEFFPRKSAAKSKMKRLQQHAPTGVRYRIRRWARVEE